MNFSAPDQGSQSHVKDDVGVGVIPLIYSKTVKIFPRSLANFPSIFPAVRGQGVANIF